MCPQLEFFPPCGFGECVNGSCVCDPGFRQSLELFYRDIEEDSIIFCDFSQLITTIVCVICFCSTALVLWAQTRSIKTRRQLKRLSPGLSGLILMEIALLIRVAKPDDDLLGVDLAFTLLFCNAYALIGIQYIILLNKYMEYVLKFDDISELTRQLTKTTIYLEYISTFAAIFSANLFTISLWVQSLNDKRSLIYAYAVITCVLNTWAALTTLIVFTKYIRDLQTVISNSADSRTAINKFVRRFQQTIAKMRAVRCFIVFFACVIVLEASLMLVSESWLKQFAFVVIFNVFMTDISMLLILRASKRKRYASTQRHDALFASAKEVSDTKHYINEQNDAVGIIPDNSAAKYGKKIHKF